MGAPQDTAEAVLIVIKRLLKWLMVGVLVLVGIAAVIGGGVWAYNYAFEDLPKSQIKILVSISDARCPDTHPVSVGVVNESKRTLKSAAVKLKARLPGHSTNYAAYPSEAEFDRILKPGESWMNCWGFKPSEAAPRGKNSKDLEWSVDYYSVRFEEK